MHSVMKYVIPGILILALLGLSFELFTNPFGFLSRILMTIGIVAAIFLIFNWVMSKRMGTSFVRSNSGPTRAQLKKAKQTSRKNTQTSPFGSVRKKIKTPSKTKPLNKARRKGNQANHLTVIEGKKTKKKSRAFF